jgi:DNA-binding GntR family transcriptional regulator
VKLDEDSGVPYYQQLYDLLKKRILSGELQGRVPSAKSLMQEYGLGRATPERVLGMLADDGLIHAVIGKGYYTVRKDQG